MSKNYDNWERLVTVVLRRELDKQIALSHSRDSSTISSTSLSAFDLIFSSTAQFDHHDDDKWLDVTNDGSSIQEIFLRRECRKIISRLVPGKRVFLPVEAREFVISSKDFPERQFSYSTHSEGFDEVVEVNSVVSLDLDIRGKIKTRLLTTNTMYGAYLVFKSGEMFEGFKAADAMMRFVYDDDVKNGVTETRVKMSVHHQGVWRVDGWMEAQIGVFYIDEEDNEENIEVRLMDVSCFKPGLIVQGIEFRPLTRMR